MASALGHPEVIDSYLQKELEQGRMSVWSSTDLTTVGCHISSFGVIPKKSKPGSWRLIVNLSAPYGCSVNDGIGKELSSLTYVSVDEVVDCLLTLGRGAQMAKIDIRQAYRNVPIHPEDRPLLGVNWKETILWDNVLTFGMRSAPLIFTAVADALQWIMQQRGAGPLFHYLDDYITLGPPGQDGCANNLAIIRQVCRDTGTPVEEDKPNNHHHLPWY